MFPEIYYGFTMSQEKVVKYVSDRIESPLPPRALPANLADDGSDDAPVLPANPVDDASDDGSDDEKMNNGSDDGPGNKNFKLNDRSDDGNLNRTKS